MKIYTGSICNIRSRIPFVPISVAEVEYIAPIADVASMRMRASAELDTTPATRSPFLTPCARSACENRPTRCRSSCQDTVDRSVSPSRTQVSAILESSFPAVETPFGPLLKRIWALAISNRIPNGNSVSGIRFRRSSIEHPGTSLVCCPFVHFRR